MKNQNKNQQIHTHKKYTYTAALCIDSQRGKSSGPRPLNMACQLKENNHTRTRAHTKTKKKPIFFNNTLNLQHKFRIILQCFLNTKNTHLGCIYIYIFFQWFTVDRFLNILVLLHATVSCIFPVFNSLSFCLPSCVQLPPTKNFRLTGGWVLYSLWN